LPARSETKRVDLGAIKDLEKGCAFADTRLEAFPARELHLGFKLVL
jgi:hypothetical protein